MFKLNQLILIGILFIKLWSLVDNTFAVSLTVTNSPTNAQTIRNKVANKPLNKMNQTSRLRDDDYEDNEGIDNSSDENLDDEEVADQEDGDGDDDDGSDDGGSDDGGSDDGGSDDGGGDGGDEPADEPGGDGPSESPPDGGGDEPAEPPGSGPGEPPGDIPPEPGEPPGDIPPGPGPGEPPGPGLPPGIPPVGGCLNPDTVFSTANAWRVRLLSQICQLSNYLLHGFHFKYKYIIKKLQHLISVLSYNQSNMNLEEMVRFLASIQNTYNQLLTGYLGVFYIIKKCQYKQLCFDCAVITGQLQKLMMDTNYTNSPIVQNELHLSNRTLLYLNSKLKNKKHNHTNHETKKMMKKKKAILIIHQVHNQAVNLTEILKINNKLHKEFNRLMRQVKQVNKKIVKFN